MESGRNSIIFQSKPASSTFRVPWRWKQKVPSEILIPLYHTTWHHISEQVISILTIMKTSHVTRITITSYKTLKMLSACHYCIDHLPNKQWTPEWSNRKVLDAIYIVLMSSFMLRSLNMPLPYHPFPEPFSNPIHLFTTITTTTTSTSTVTKQTACTNICIYEMYTNPSPKHITVTHILGTRRVSG